MAAEVNKRKKSQIPLSLANLIVLTVAWGLAWCGWIIYATLNPHQKVFRTKTHYSSPNYKKFRRFSDVLVQSKKLKKPIFLDLYATWCYPCKKLEKQTFSHPSIRAILDNYLVVKFNISKPEGKRLLRRYRVYRFPTTLMLNWRGQEVERVVGFQPPRFFRPALLAAYQMRDRYFDILRQLRHNPKDIALSLKVADRAILNRHIRMARRLYKEALKADPRDSKGFGSAGLFGWARSHTRISEYKQALPLLVRFHKEFPSSAARIDAYRLQIYVYKKLRKYKERGSTIALFHKRYPNQPIDFE